MTTWNATKKANFVVCYPSSPQQLFSFAPMDFYTALLQTFCGSDTQQTLHLPQAAYSTSSFLIGPLTGFVPSWMVQIKLGLVQSRSQAIVACLGGF